MDRDGYVFDLACVCLSRCAQGQAEESSRELNVVGVEVGNVRSKLIDTPLACGLKFRCASRMRSLFPERMCWSSVSCWWSASDIIKEQRHHT